MKAASRNALLARVHCIRKEQGWDEDTYRDVLEKRSREACGTAYRSAGDMPAKVLAQVVAALGWQKGDKPGDKPRNEWAFVFQAVPDRQPHLKKLYKLAEGLKVDKAYIEGIARQMASGVETRLEFCDAARLHQIVQAVEFYKRRQGIRT